MNAERLLQHYEQIADAPDAISRLRRFILNLAVRGKLVPQDPADEPASELLKRIAKAKSLSDRKERTKKQSEDPTKDGKGVPLPAGWTFAPLADLVAVINGRAYKQQELLSAGTPVLRVGNLFTSDKWYYSDLQLPEDKYCERADLIFAWSASFGPFIWDGEKVIYHYHIWKLVLHSEADLNKLYLYNFLLQKTREIKEAGHGISMIHMTKEKMDRLSVPLPPLAEQHRIVAKVDQLMALCDELEAARTAREAKRDRLTAASLARLNAPAPETFRDDARFALCAVPALTARPDQIKQLRQTILNLAVRGKLVPQDPADEPASELLKRIAKAKSLSDRKERTKKQSEDPTKDGKGVPLPAGWTFAPLADLVAVINGRAYKQQELLSAGTPVLRVGNLFTSDKWYYSDLQLPEDKYCERADLIFAWSASFGPFIWDGEKVIYHYHIWKLVLHSEADLNKLYLYNFLLQKTREIKEAGHGISMIHMTKEKMDRLSVPLPPLAEQHRIVAKVDQLMALCDELEASLTRGDDTRRKLLDALLAEALVPMDAVTLQEAAE
ncbi:restriction endonuclease subunit S [Rhizobium phaseoli]|uniref:restriction endonuclease subunit S n=1 Tax=Rhizobium phaseoli TaxID=396 RepID=UPI000E0D5761|nr:restriction endonuclease subunit S [Rhizobium phaseoli]RDJ14689.1 hypothetical protein B5K04_07495 [Rhizobium phaseoli]